MKKRSNRKTSAATGMFIGIPASLILCLIGIWILTELILRERVGEGSAKILIPIVLMVASLAGIQINCIVQGRYDINVALMTSGILAILLLIAGLLVDGPFRMVGYNLTGIGIGCFISCVICLKKMRNVKARKRGYR